MKNTGLKRLPFSFKDFNHNKKFGATKSALPGLPLDFTRQPLAIKDQEFSNFCTGYATSSASEYQEGIILSPEYQTAAIGRIVGKPIFDGANPRDALKAACSYGSLPESKSPFKFQIDGWDKPARWEKWSDEYNDMAYEYRKRSFYKVTFGWPDDFDVFDSIRVALWIGRHENSVVMGFGFWYNVFNTTVGGIVPVPTDKPTNRHAYLFTGWKMINGVQYLVAQLSQGTNYGDGGLLYFSREAVNTAYKNPMLNGLGLFCYRDIDKDEGKTSRLSVLDFLKKLFT